MLKCDIFKYYILNSVFFYNWESEQKKKYIFYVIGLDFGQLEMPIQSIVIGQISVRNLQTNYQNSGPAVCSTAIR